MSPMKGIYGQPPFLLISGNFYSWICTDHQSHLKMNRHFRYLDTFSHGSYTCYLCLVPKFPNNSKSVMCLIRMPLSKITFCLNIRKHEGHPKGGKYFSPAYCKHRIIQFRSRIALYLPRQEITELDVRISHTTAMLRMVLSRQWYKFNTPFLHQIVYALMDWEIVWPLNIRFPGCSAHLYLYSETLFIYC